MVGRDTEIATVDKLLSQHRLVMRAESIAALDLGRGVPAGAELAAMLRGYFDSARAREALALDSTEANSY